MDRQSVWRRASSPEAPQVGMIPHGRTASDDLPAADRVRTAPTLEADDAPLREVTSGNADGIAHAGGDGGRRCCRTTGGCVSTRRLRNCPAAFTATSRP